MKIRFAVGPILLSVLMCGATTASAQPPGSRLEVGVQATMLRFSDFGQTNAGIGGRVLFDLSRWAAVDAEGNFTPDDDVLSPQAPTDTADLRIAYRRQRADGFFGLKLGHRAQRFGVFAKVRPGFVRQIDRGISCLGADCARVLMLLVRPEYRTEFALDLGGGAEFYPTRRTVARVEFGDTIIRHPSTAPLCATWRPEDTCTTHNLATRVGMGWRF